MREFERLPNPDNVPGDASTGYKRQNTNMFAIQTGIDTTVPFDDGNGRITIPIGGIIEMSSSPLVEMNGVLFRLTEELVLYKPENQANTAFWIAIRVNADGTASAALENRPGVWDPARQGCYLADGRRTLNWVSRGNLANEPTTGAEWSVTTLRGRYGRSLAKGWKQVRLASGMGGSSTSTPNMQGGNGTATAGGSGGAGGLGDRVTMNNAIYFHAGGNAVAHIGGNGARGHNGGNGGNGEGGGGGGGGGGHGTGEESMFLADGFSLVAGKAPCGVGGPGGTGHTGGGAGGRGGYAGSPGRNGVGGGHVSGSGSGAAGLGGQALGVLNGQPGGESPYRYGPGGGGAGGMSGINGWDRPEGISGGFCNVFALGN